MKKRLNKIFILFSGVMILSLIPLSQKVSYSSTEYPEVIHIPPQDNPGIIQISSAPESAIKVADNEDRIITTNFKDTENPIIEINKIEEKKEEVKKEEQHKPEMVNMGSYKLTAYCSCSKCCGSWSKYNKTESGTTPKQGRTVAVDKTKIPLGSHLIINGQEYIAEDTGSGVKSNHIDIYFNSHREALNFGVQHATVYMIK